MDFCPCGHCAYRKYDINSEPCYTCSRESWTKFVQVKDGIKPPEKINELKKFSIDDLMEE